MSASYPYWSFARDKGLDYGEVLAAVAIIEQMGDQALSNEMRKDPPLPLPYYSDLVDCVWTEYDRRSKVSLGVKS